MVSGRTPALFGMPFLQRSPLPPALPLFSLLMLVPAASCVPPTASVEEGVVTQWGRDVLAAGRAPRVTTAITGDVLMAGGDVWFSGTAEGDYLGAGGRQVVGGSLGGNARAAGGDVELRAQVERNATLAGGRVHLADGARVGGNAYLAGGLVIVDGQVDAHLRAMAGEIILNGEIDGSVSVDGQSLRVGPAARIGGDLRYRVPEGGVSVDPAAQIGGERVQLETRAPDLPALPQWRWLLRGLWALGFLFTGAVLMLLFPGTAGASAEGLGRRPGASAGLGLVWLVLAPLAIALAVASVIGLPLAFILIAVFAISLYVARVVPALWLGRRILGERSGPGRGAVLAAFLLGGIVLVVAELLPVLGPAVLLVATLFGLGALILGLGAREEALQRDVPPPPRRAPSEA